MAKTRRKTNRPKHNARVRSVVKRIRAEHGSAQKAAKHKNLEHTL